MTAEAFEPTPQFTGRDDSGAPAGARRAGGSPGAFHGLCITTGMQVLQAMMEGDREDLCGPKGRHQEERSAWRGGSAASQVTLGGRQVAAPRLRVRSADGEVALPSFRWAAATERAHAVCGRGRGIDAAVCGHVGPGAGRGDGAGAIESNRPNYVCFFCSGDDPDALRQSHLDRGHAARGVTPGPARCGRSSSISGVGTRRRPRPSTTRCGRSRSRSMWRTGTTST